ncbi:hypothetical protein N665_0497s0029 [Sinapis alba]|nr:hypothetical protein N665_0497s0029 [Sinapis alba]
MKQMDNAMRDVFGMILREIKFVADRIEVVAERVEALEQLVKSTKGTASNEAPHTSSEPPKRTDEFGVNDLPDDLPDDLLEKTYGKSSGKSSHQTIYGKSSDQRGRRDQSSKSSQRGKALKEAKAAKEAREAKEAEETKSAKEAREAKEAKAAKEAEEAKEDKASEASVVIMDKKKPTASDLKTEEARRLAKSEAGLANVRAMSERERKLASSQQSPFQRNITTKIIIPNKKIGRGYDPFAFPVEKHRISALTNWLKEDR